MNAINLAVEYLSSVLGVNALVFDNSNTEKAWVFILQKPQSDDEKTIFERMKIAVGANVKNSIALFSDLKNPVTLPSNLVLAKVVVFGKAPPQLEVTSILEIPTLEQMQKDPAAKKQAWEILKPFAPKPAN